MRQRWKVLSAIHREEDYRGEGDSGEGTLTVDLVLALELRSDGG